MHTVTKRTLYTVYTLAFFLLPSPPPLSLRFSFFPPSSPFAPFFLSLPPDPFSA